MSSRKTLFALVAALVLVGAAATAMQLNSHPSRPTTASAPVRKSHPHPQPAPPLPAPHSVGGILPANLPPASGIRGVFLTGWVAGSTRLPQLLAQFKQGGVNTVVINVKDDGGHLTWAMNLPEAKAIGADSQQIPDIKTLLATLRQNHIYAVGRIVTFKDPVLAQANPAQAVHTPDGALWHDTMGEAWLDPYNQANWRYVMGIAKQAAHAGFQEIQFDYVRFPSDGNLSGLVYPAATKEPPAQVITDFLTYAKQQLAPYRVEVGADVFGLVTVAKDDMGIGQELDPVAKTVNILSPMTYPSLYSPHSFGYSVPALQPYNVVYQSLATAQQRLAKNKIQVDMVPWIQDFSLNGVTYGSTQVQEQIKAVEAADGTNQWMLWNPACVYNLP